MAILPEHARQWASRLAPDELARQIYDRLLAPTPVPVGHGKVEEFPEDVVIALLQDEAVTQEQHRAVARGWTQARYAVQVVLEPPELEPDCEKRQSLQEPFTRVFRVAELTGHPLLRSGVRSALPLVVATPSYATARQVQQVVAAAIAYPDEVDRETWARALHTREEIVAFAFRMLLVLDRRDESRIAEHFACVLEKQFVERWNLDAWFLGEFIRTAGMTDSIRRGVEQFLAKHPDKWADVLLNRNGNPCWPDDVVEQITQPQSEPIVRRVYAGYRRDELLDVFGTYDFSSHRYPQTIQNWSGRFRFRKQLYGELNAVDEPAWIKCREKRAPKPELAGDQNRPLLCGLASGHEYSEEAFAQRRRSNTPTRETIGYTKV